MAPPNRNGGALCRVRLADIPLSVRRRHGVHLIRRAANAGDLRESVAIQNAVERPSPRDYWIPADAYHRVMGASP